MSVILTKAHDYLSSTGKPCNSCSKKLYPPFFEWHCDITFRLCKTCARNCKSGIQLDLIHLSAIAEMHNVSDGYYRLTLDRDDVTAAEKKEQEPEMMGVAFIRKSKGQNGF